MNQSKGPFQHTFDAPYEQVVDAALQAVRAKGFEITDGAFPGISPIVRFRLPNQTVECNITVGGQDESHDTKPNCKVFFSLPPTDQRTLYDLIGNIMRLLKAKT